MPELTDMKILNELIAAGWGSVPQTLIPPDWRNRNPPDRNIREECLEDAIEEEPVEPGEFFAPQPPAFRKTLCPRQRRGKWRQREVGKVAAGGWG